MKRTFSCVLFVLTTVALSAQSLKPWKVKLSTGQNLRVVNTSVNSISQEMMGQKMLININGDVTDSVYIKSEFKGGFNISRVTTRLKLEMDMMGQHKTIDSDKKEDMEGEGGSKLKEKVGVVSEATVLENGSTRITSATKESETDLISGMMAMNNDSASVASLFLVPPGKELKRGETWSETFASSGLNSETVYTYEKTEQQVAFIRFVTKSGMSNTVTSNGMEVKVNIKAEGEGTLKLELKTGLVLERVTTQKMSGTSEVMGMEIPLTGETKSTVLISKL